MINIFNMTIVNIFLLLLILMFFSPNMVFSASANNQTKTTSTTDNVKLGTMKELLNALTPIIPVITAVITVIVTLYLGMRKYREEKEKQLSEYKNKLEFDYDIKLREQRITVYERLWELTKIDFDINTTTYKIKNKVSQLNDWYYYRGQGMLLTESSQKLYYNYKKTLENLKEQWENLQSCQICEERKEKRGQCYHYVCKGRKCKYCEIKFLGDIGSGFRTNLLKDIGTREELKKPSPYYDIYIQCEDKTIKSSNYFQNIEFNFIYVGNQTMKLKNSVILIIRNIDKNKPEIIKHQTIHKLVAGGKYSVSSNLENFDKKPLEVGNYSLKIVADSISGEQTFNFDYVYDKGTKKTDEMMIKFY